MLYIYIYMYRMNNICFWNEIMVKNSSVEIVHFFLPIISPAPGSCDLFRLVQNSWVFLKVLQESRMPEGFGHQNFSKLPRYILDSLIGRACNSPWNSVVKSSGEFSFYIKISKIFLIEMYLVQKSENSPWLRSPS